MPELSSGQLETICSELASDEGLATAGRSVLGGVDVATPNLSLSAEASDLQLPAHLLMRISAALGHSNVRLIGPPGTGKSTLAKAVLEAAVGDEYVFTVATGQWTGEDVIGGPVPDPADSTSLVFRPGLILAAAEAGKWVGIDEINRADIDSAFGELFGLLSGFDLELPYVDSAQNANNIKVYAERPVGELNAGEYGLPEGWRMIATMNSWDKLSLSRVSFAFSRRWCTIFLPVPEPTAFQSILDQFIEQLFPIASEGVRSALHYLFASSGSETVPSLRSLGFAMGPGIAKSMIRDIASMNGTGMSDQIAIGASLDGFVLPQLEGALEAHVDLLACLSETLRLVGDSAPDLIDLDGKLGVFTGRRSSSGY